MSENGKKITLVIILSTLYFLCSFSQIKPYRLSIHNPELAGQSISIAYYYGKSVLLHGETKLNEKGLSRYEKIDHKGIYLLIINDSTKFEFMVSDTGDYTLHWHDKRWEINSCPSSEAFRHLLQSNRRSGRAIDSIRILSKTSPPDEDSPYRAEIQKIKLRNDSLTEALAKNHKGTFAGCYFNALLPVRIPDLKQMNPGISDSALWFAGIHYYRNHFLDGINWEEPGLIYTPLIEEKMVTYLGKIVPRDHIYHASLIDSLLNKITNTEMQEYALRVLVRHYRTSLKDPVCEFAYIYLIGKYFTNAPPSWAEPALLERMKVEAERRKPASIGNEAPNIILPDRSGGMVSLEDISADVIILLFWDYSCPSCQRILDDFRKAVNRYNYKDIHVYTIFTGSDKEIWEAWVERRLHPAWTNTILNDHQDILRQYYIEKTPMLFLLNEEKLITDKGMTVPELERYLSSLSY